MTNSCTGCGVCCKLFLINLSQKEYESGSYQTMFFQNDFIESFKQAKKYGAHLLAKKNDGSCIYLNDKKCSIHSTRPFVCRQFFCNSQNKRFSGMVKLIKQVKEKLI